jgi:hypothetical protein
MALLTTVNPDKKVVIVTKCEDRTEGVVVMLKKQIGQAGQGEVT